MSTPGILARSETALIRALLQVNLEAGERELLRLAKSWRAKLPFDPIDLLIVDEMGKDVSGSGMDTNIIGRHVNGLTACSPGGVKLPTALDSAQDAIAVALACLGKERIEDARVVRIKNTLRLTEVEVSEVLVPEVARREDLTLLGEPAPLGFDAAGALLPF